MSRRVEMPAKIASEVKSYTCDFSDLLGSETISTQTVTATVYSGTDSNPSAIISGSASKSGSIVTQLITGGVAGVIYDVTWAITTSGGQTLKKSGYLAVVPDLV